MNTITSFSTDKNFSTGFFAQRTFQRTGKIFIVFHINTKYIGASIEGFATGTMYVKTPKTNKEKRINQFFIERYVNPCSNAEELKQQLFKF